jgi:2-iminobutanoate/2-iminopropanoate deaminase
MKSATVTPGKTYGPYSITREAGAFVYVSGQIGIDPATGTASPDITAQTDQALQNVASALQQAGLGLADVIDVTIFLTDMKDFAEVNSVYAQHFSKPYPSRTCVAVSELPKIGSATHLLVEIKVIAMKRAR